MAPSFFSSSSSRHSACRQREAGACAESSGGAREQTQRNGRNIRPHNRRGALKWDAPKLTASSHVRYGAAERLRRESRLTGRNDPDPVTSRLA